MWLPWQLAVLGSVGLAAFGLSARRTNNSRVLVAGAFARETALVLALYAIWQIAGQLSVMQVTGALDRGRWVWKIERMLHLPSEVSVQKAVLPNRALVQGANSYYAIAHVPALIAFLVWLFVRHRDRYPQVRNVLAIATGAALAVQLVPLAPPRMFPGLGFVDTAERYHQSVYGPLGRGLAGQLSAMPSIHVAWAVLIGVAIFQIGRGPGRWIGPGHAVLTVLVVVITANHWWLDGLVAVMLLGLAWVADSSIRGAARMWQSRIELRRPDIVMASHLGEGSVAVAPEPGRSRVAERDSVPGVRVP